MVPSERRHRYDHYDRNGPKIFAGEYAAQSDHVVSVRQSQYLELRFGRGGVHDRTPVERNADVVQMASYAPLFAHVDGWQWTPDLIWFDNLRSYGTPDLLCPKSFSPPTGDPSKYRLPKTARPLTGQDSLYGSACIDNATHELIIKLVNVSAHPQTPLIQLQGVTKTASEGRFILLTARQRDAVNSLDDPTAPVSPTESHHALQGQRK